MYLTIVILPIISAFLGTIGRILGTTGIQILTTICISFSAILSIVGFYEVCLSGSPVSIYLISWTYSLPLDISWSLLFDDLTISILIPVLIVSSLVHLYSISYINEDPHVQRFISYLSYFTAAIVVLVVGDSYLMIFVGWESIGVASYLLIGYWITRGQASKAANQAIIVNRVGDTILSVGFIVLMWSTGSIEYAVSLSVGINLPEVLIIIITLLLFGGAISKSAQIPLHTWLPTAIEGYILTIELQNV